MGEYAKRKSDGEEVKIGTCESMYYLRYEDREKVLQLPNSLNAATVTDCFWRVPFPDEDAVRIGDYGEHDRGERLWKTLEENGKTYSVDFKDETTIENPGMIQLSHRDSGLLVNVACYHGHKLPEGSKDFRPAWNGKGWALELVHVKNTAAGVFPVVHCRFCGDMWRYSWEEILPYVQDEELKARLERHVQQTVETL